MHLKQDWIEKRQTFETTARKIVSILSKRHPKRKYKMVSTLETIYIVRVKSLARFMPKFILKCLIVWDNFFFGCKKMFSIDHGFRGFDREQGSLRFMCATVYGSEGRSHTKADIEMFLKEINDHADCYDIELVSIQQFPCYITWQEILDSKSDN